MCGIAGIVAINRAPVDPDLLLRMTRFQAHRGPDDEGLWHQGPIGLGHRRLSIIDLSAAGHQPMASADGRYQLIFNGEIYNYIELKKELKAMGYTFCSQSDTEVLLTAYAAWGPRCVARFIGMWAFAIWDQKKECLFCSRDPFGIKPFFMYQDNQFLYFASDIRALLLVDDKAREPNWQFLLRQMSSYRFSRFDETSFEHIRALPPATNLTVEKGQLAFDRYWKPSIEKIRKDYDYENPVQTFSDLFSDSVRIHFRSDVPVGVCLSGGLDSSAIVAAATANLDARLKTFSISYPGSMWSEDTYFNAINHRYGCDAYLLTPEGAKDYLETLDRMVKSHGEPDQGIGVYSQWKVIELARSQVKVLLDGQGGDELLAGYPYFYNTYLGHLIRSGRLIHALHEFRAYRPYAPKEFGRDVARSAFPELAAWFRRVSGDKGTTGFLESFHPEFIDRLFPGRNGLRDEDLFADLFTHRNRHRFSENNADPLSEHLYRTISVDLLQSLLYFEDRNSMAFSMESRVPFLDRRLVEFCLGLPSDRRLKNGYTKMILRDSMTELLPDAVLHRRDKKGYPTPLSLWLRGPLMNQVKDLLLDRRATDRNLLDRGTLEKRLNEHHLGSRDHTVDIFNAVTLELWFQRFQDSFDSFVDTTSEKPLESPVIQK